MAVLVNVHAGGGEQAIKNLKRKMQRELVYRSMKESRYYKPKSVKRVIKLQEAQRRRKKNVRKKLIEDN